MNSTNLAATMNHILENRPPILSSKNLMEEKQPKKKTFNFQVNFSHSTSESPMFLSIRLDDEPSTRIETWMKHYGKSLVALSCGFFLPRTRLSGQPFNLISTIIIILLCTWLKFQPASTCIFVFKKRQCVWHG